MVRKINIVRQSKKYKLNKTDGKKILKGAYIAVLGALLTYLAQVLGNVDFGQYTPVIVALGGIMINLGNKYIKGK